MKVRAAVVRSSLTGTLMAIENMIKDEIDPEIEVVAV